MESPTEKITVQQSLDIITAMIQQAKGNVRRNSFYFVLWGWTITLANLGMYALIHLNYSSPFIVWFITIPAWLISMYRGYQQGETISSSSTHLSKITAWLWICYGVVLFTIVMFGYKINYQLNPVILLLSAVPTFISGVIIKFKPLQWGGVALWICGVVCFLVPTDVQFLVGALATVLGYLVPGYSLKNKQED